MLLTESDHHIQGVIAYTEREIAWMNGPHIHQTLTLQRNDIYLNDAGRLIGRVGRLLVEMRVSIVDVHSDELQGEGVVAWEEWEGGRPSVGQSIDEKLKRVRCCDGGPVIGRRGIGEKNGVFDCVGLANLLVMQG